MARFLLFVLLALALSACNLPSAPAATATPDAIATRVGLLLTEVAAQAAYTATSAPAPTPTTTPAPIATEEIPTPTATFAAATLTSVPTEASNPPDWKDTLDDSQSFYKYENDNTRVTQEGGHLILTGIHANGWLGWSLTFSRKPVNFYLEAVFITQACSGNDLYGLVFRAPNANKGYFFGVTCNGQYNLHVRDFENNSDTVLVSMTRSSAIHPGPNQTNRLGVRAEADKIRLYANGALLQESSDSTFSEGNFGAFVAANETPGFSVWMEEISLWDLP